MKTYSFIGSDKNAGKTTALTFFYQQLLQRRYAEQAVFLTSIGINGESVDTFEGKDKPPTRIFRNSLFITAGDHLRQLGGQYQILHVFDRPGFTKLYVLARATNDFVVVLEGPNDRDSVLKMKKVMSRVAANSICLIDGSIDRQFLGHPSISDALCFALLISSRPQQQQKAQGFLTALGLEKCSSKATEIIDASTNDSTKSVLILNWDSTVYKGYKIPYLDDQLRSHCLEHRDKPCLLYIKGSLSRSLYRFLAPLQNLTIVLHDFTCYQNINTGNDPPEFKPELRDRTKITWHKLAAKVPKRPDILPTECQVIFEPTLRLRHIVPLEYLFIRQESDQARIDALGDVPAINLYRDDLDDFRI